MIMGKKKILYSPIHYVLDSKNLGSEISWSYYIYKYISKSSRVDSTFITGGVRGVEDQKVIDCKVFSPERLNLLIINIIYFYLKIFLKGFIILRTKKIDLIHHVLPFGPNSLNFLPFFSRTKFVIGPIQVSLSVQDLDVSEDEPLGFNMKKRKSFLSFLNTIFFSLIKPVLYSLSTITLKKADVVIVINNEAKKEIQRRGVSAKKIKVIPPGIEVNKFKFVPFLNKFSGKIEFVVVSYLRKRKAVDLVIMAMSDVVKKNKNVRLTIVGDGPQMEYLKELVRKNKLESYVEFVGFVSQEKIHSVYEKSHVFISMSRAESWGQMYLEAMAAGLPIITSKNVGSESIIRDGRFGYLINQENVNDLRKRMLELSLKHKKISEFGLRARDEVVNKYDWEKKIIPQYLDLYEQIK